jgi:hypothetical protein
MLLDTMSWHPQWVNNFDKSALVVRTSNQEPKQEKEVLFKLNSVAHIIMEYES